ncbi:hypothetical protein [Thermovibrio sp.]
MSCSCRKGKSLSQIETKEIEKLIKLLKRNPKAFLLILEVINSFRPTDTERVKAERLFLAVKDILELSLIDYSEGGEVLKTLKELILKDKGRGDFLEVLLSKVGPLTFNGRYKRVNQCKVFKGNRKLSEKEIDVAFSGKEALELHECKVNMVRQWRDPLRGKNKKAKKLLFLNSLPLECKNGKEVIPFCTSLDGKMGIEYVKLVFKFYRFNRIELAGRGELFEKLFRRERWFSETGKRQGSS